MRLTTYKFKILITVFIKEHLVTFEKFWEYTGCLYENIIQKCQNT